MSDSKISILKGRLKYLQMGLKNAKRGSKVLSEQFYIDRIKIVKEMINEKI